MIRFRDQRDLQIYLYITIDLLVSSPDLSESFNLNITTFRAVHQTGREKDTEFKASSPHRKELPSDCSLPEAASKLSLQSHSLDHLFRDPFIWSGHLVQCWTPLLN